MEGFEFNNDIILYITSFLEESSILKSLAAADKGHFFKNEYFRQMLKTSSKVQTNCFYSADFFALKGDLFSFLERQDDLVVAGGFATQLWIGNEPKLSSDIDVFILSETGKHAVKDYLCKHQHVVETPRGNTYCSLFQVRMADIPYVIQFIYVEKTHTVADVLRNFDFSYCRCALYLGKLYAWPDAKISLEKKECVVYRTSVRNCRINKAYRYVDKVLNIREAARECYCNLNNSAWRRYCSIPCITRGSFGQYSDSKSHNTTDRRDAIYVNAPRKLTFLEDCAQMRLHIVFSLTYFSLEQTASTLWFPPNLFKTRDPRYKDVQKLLEKIDKPTCVKRPFFSKICQEYSFNVFRVDKKLTDYANGKEYTFSVSEYKNKIYIEDMANF